MRGSLAQPVLIALLALAAAAAGAAPTIDTLLALKVEGMSEGERLQNAAYCLDAGRQAREQGKFGAALDLFNKTLELNSEETEARWEKAIMFGDDRLGLRTQALAELRLFLATNPNHGHALAQLGWNYQQKGRVAEAEEQYKLAMTKDSSDWWIWERYGDLLIRFTDRVQEGIDYEKSAVARGDTEPWAQMILAHGYARLGKYPEARASAMKAIALLRPMGMDEPIADMNQLLHSIEGK
jgi:tetratricopeptide (TPR) repeat protein